MQPFPPSILLALLSDPRRHAVNDEVRALRERSGRSRIRSQRRFRLRADESSVTVSAVRLGGESTGTA